MTLQRVRLALFVLAAVLAVVASLGLATERATATFDVMLVVDITGSMNARDERIDGEPASRLDRLRRSLPDLAAALPCGSRIGLSVFTERRAFTLYDPVEVCGAYPVLAESFNGLNWRIAWEGDSRVASGLHHALTAAAGRGYDLVFLTDGHEAPPLPWTGGPAFEGERGAVGGLIVGVGGTTPVPIPKHDDRGRETGFYTMAEIPQESRLGTPPPDAESRPGWHPRNNPFGEMPAGIEHLTELRERYLVGLADSVGLGYARLGAVPDLVEAIARHARPHALTTRHDLSPLVGAAALVAAAASFLARLLAGLVHRRKGDPLKKHAPLAVLVAASFVLAATSAKAHGPTPQKVAEGIDIASPCELVWSKLRDFGSIGSWHPGVTAVEATGASERGATRTLTLPNGEQVTEKLDELNGGEQSLSYRLSKENLKALPVSFYTAKMIVSRPDPGPRCRVDWEGRFYRGDTTNEPPPELSDEAAVAAMTDFFKTGLTGLKAKMEQ